MTIYLIRHGKTEANERRLYCGSSDYSLSQRGIEELRKLKYDLSADIYLTSGMRRTEQTLAALFGEVPHGVEPRFREVNFGVFEGKSYEQLKDDPDYRRWITGDNESNVPPMGESGAQMTRRVLEAYRELTVDTVVITHGGVIAAIMASLFPGENKSRYDWQPPCGHGYAITDDAYRPIP